MKTKKKILAWDTASPTGIVVALEIDLPFLKPPDAQEKPTFNVVAEWSLSLETSRHSERLLWAIDTVLKKANWTLEGVDGFAVGVGPGSFTGLRIGITTVRMLAEYLKIPVAPISSLQILLSGVQKTENTIRVACTDASKGEWFVAFETEESAEESVVAPEIALQKIEDYLNTHENNQWMVVGQSAERYPQLFDFLPKSRRVEVAAPDHFPQPLALAKLAFKAIISNKTEDFEAIRPRYLRDSDAEVKLKKGLLKPQNLIYVK